MTTSSPNSDVASRNSYGDDNTGKNNSTDDPVCPTSFTKEEDTDHTVSTDESSTSTSRPPSGPETIAAVREVMEQAGLLPLAVVGVVLNVLTLWVWQAESIYNATTFLFKYLAFWDFLCLTTFVLYISRVDDILGEMVLPVSNVSQRVSVHTTLLVSIVRWLAVSRPLHVRALLSVTRVRLACLSLLLWCAAIEVLFLYASYGSHIDRETAWTLYYLQRMVGLALPLVLMLVFNVLLVVKSRRKPAQELGQRISQRQVEARHHLTLAVGCISLCCLISYPLSIVTETSTSIHCFEGDVYVCDPFLEYYVKYATFVLQIVNLSVNFAFYLAFVSRFRQLLALRMHLCLEGGCCCGPRDTAAEGAAGDKVAYKVSTVENSWTS